jgi:hypothetical protein
MNNENALDCESKHELAVSGNLTKCWYFIQGCVLLVIINCRYKCEKNGVPITAVAGSTTPLVEKPALDEEAGYNPYEHRNLTHPTR